MLFPYDDWTQHQGCGALARGANSPANRAAIADAGGIEAVTGAMARGDLYLQRIGCLALGNLAEDSPANQAAIAGAGGPSIPWRAGRVDAMDPKTSVTPDGRLPAADKVRADSSGSP